VLGRKKYGHGYLFFGNREIEGEGRRELRFKRKANEGAKKKFKSEIQLKKS